VIGQDKVENVWVAIPLSPPERSRLDVVCGPGRKSKRGQWVAEAIVEKMDRAGVPYPEGPDRPQPDQEAQG
jgi:hypothetical protein